jgi:undecaprenyl diphosphate synthase
MIQNLYKIPQHVAIIMDGNGRWAKRRGLPRVFGHREGAKTVERVIDIARDNKIKWLSLFAFSTENWNRPKEEVEAIMSLLVEYINTKVPSLIERDVRLRFMGRREGLSEMILKTMEEGEKATEHCKTMNLVVALNYSGKAEIIDAAKKIAKEGKTDITEEEFRKYLYIPEMPEPDLLIRTSGEKRISNFMLWELAYTELFFTETLWPDFDEEDFAQALYEYQSRERRFGRVLENK